jgi:hypothetical protein
VSGASAAALSCLTHINAQEETRAKILL